MTLQQAAQSALGVQNACNLSGILGSLHTIVSEVLWPASNGKGTRWVNGHPIVAMFLFKMGELNGYGISSLMEGYEKAERECIALTAEGGLT